MMNDEEENSPKDTKSQISQKAWRYFYRLLQHGGGEGSQLKGTPCALRYALCPMRYASFDLKEV
jgi:hypothetical protein